MLSRVYLYMQEWKKAKEVIEPYLSNNQFKLESIVDRDFVTEDTPFLTDDNSE